MLVGNVYIVFKSVMAIFLPAINVNIRITTVNHYDSQPAKIEFGVVNEKDTALVVGKINTKDLMSNTLQVDRCERIIFRDKTLDFVFELPEPYYKDIDTIIINGIKFKKTE